MRSSGWPRFRRSSSTGRPRTGAPGSSPSTWPTSIRTTWPRCSTWRASRSAPATTVASRSCRSWAWPRRTGPASTCTRCRRRSTGSWRACTRREKSSPRYPPGVSDFYREVILDHYKNPRGHGAMEAPDATAEGLNPLCGDEVTISVALADDGETIDEVKFEGRGCAISQAATSMLTEMVKGRSATDVATLPKEELLEEIGIPLTPIRLKCALLGLGVLKVALHRAKGTPLPAEWAGLASELEIS